MKRYAGHKSENTVWSQQQLQIVKAVIMNSRKISKFIFKEKNISSSGEGFTSTASHIIWNRYMSVTEYNHRIELTAPKNCVSSAKIKNVEFVTTLHASLTNALKELKL